MLSLFPFGCSTVLRHDIPPTLIFAIPIPNPNRNVNPGGLVVTTGGRNSVRNPTLTPKPSLNTALRNEVGTNTPLRNEVGAESTPYMIHPYRTHPL